MRKIDRYRCSGTILTLIGLSLIGCGKERAPGRVLVIGIDGASPTLVRNWASASKLPNLSQLASQGGFGELRSHHMLLSPRIWTSIATGKFPQDHRIEGWVHGEGPRKGLLYRSSDRAGAALWNILSDRGHRVGVVNWTITYPPEKVAGVMVSDLAVPGTKEARRRLGDQFGRDGSLPAEAAETALATWPPEWAERVRQLARPGKHLEPVAEPGADWAGDPFVSPIIENARTTDDLAVRVALEIEREERPDLLMVLLPGIDRMSHYYWSGIASPADYPEDRRLPAAEHKQQGKILFRYYNYADALVGLLTARYGRNDLILVISDHGFEAVVHEQEGITGGHQTPAAEYGIVFARGPGIPAGVELKGMSVNDITPTILAWLGLPVAADMSGSPAIFLQHRTLPTYNKGPIERVGGNADKLEEDALKRLRSLGYLK